MREIKFRAWDGENMNSEFIITGQEIDNSPLDLEIVGNIYENKDLLEAKEI